MNITDIFVGVVLGVGVPVYLYFVVRILTSAIVRSFFETKIEFETKKKEVI